MQYDGDYQISNDKIGNITVRLEARIQRQDRQVRGKKRRKRFRKYFEANETVSFQPTRRNLCGRNFVILASFNLANGI